MSVYVPNPRDCSQLSTFSSACFYFSYLAQFQFTDSKSSATASSVTVHQGQAMELHKTSQGSRPAGALGCVCPEPDSTAQGSRVVPLWHQSGMEQEGQLHGPDPIWMRRCSRLAPTGISFFTGMHTSFNTWSEMHQSRRLTFIQRAW